MPFTLRHRRGRGSRPLPPSKHRLEHRPGEYGYGLITADGAVLTWPENSARRIPEERAAALLLDFHTTRMFAFTDTGTVTSADVVDDLRWHEQTIRLACRHVPGLHPAG